MTAEMAPLRPAQPRAGDIPRRFYHPELDVLRFVAFFAVFIGHAFPVSPQPYIAHHGFSRPAAIFIAGIVHSGGFGVTLFFLLSSYLITTLLLREHAANGRLDVKSFYLRRTLRIWPLYFFFLALCFWVLPALGWPYFPNIQKLGFSFFVGNWTLTYFSLSHTPIFPLWSVSVEEQFYIFWPLALTTFGFRQLRRMAFVLLVIAMLTRLIVIPFHPKINTIWFNSLVQLDPIAVGALLALAFRNGSPILTFRLRVLLVWAGIVILPASLLQFGLTGWGILLTYPLATAGAAMIFVATFTDSPPFWLRKGPLVYLGKISYGLYVFHMLMLDLATQIWPDARAVRTLIAFFGTVAIAAISYRFLERPFLKLKARFAYIASRPV